MNNEVDTFSGMLRLLLARIAETLQGLSESQLNWRPPVPKANSAYAIATHTLSNARAWVLGIACGQPMNRDRPAEFRASGPSAAALVDEAKRLAQDIEAALAPLTSADLDRRLVPAPDLWGEGQPYENLRPRGPHSRRRARRYPSRPPAAHARPRPGERLMRFVKMHGTGNDFVLVEAKGDERDWPRLAVAVCDRHFGIGADGLLLILPSDRAAVRMRVLNPDGSEPEMCGNGIRCLAKYAVERGLLQPKDDRFDVETAAGVLTLQIERHADTVERVRVGMGMPRFAPEEIPVLVNANPPLINIPIEIEHGDSRGILPLTAVSMGNPHAVLFPERPVAAFPLAEVAPSVVDHRLFPHGVNFEVARVIDRSHIEARVWERGAGPTLACGTGASAVMVAAHLQRLVDDKVDITLPGGTLTLEWDGSGEVFMTGPAVTVFEGDWLGA